MPKKVFGVFCLGKPDKPKQITHAHTHKSHKCHPFERHLLYMIHMVWQIFGKRKSLRSSTQQPRSLHEKSYTSNKALGPILWQRNLQHLQHSYVVSFMKLSILGTWSQWLGFLLFNVVQNKIANQQKASKKESKPTLVQSIWIVLSNWTCVLCLLYLTSLIAWNPNLKKQS